MAKKIKSPVGASFALAGGLSAPGGYDWAAEWRSVSGSDCLFRRLPDSFLPQGGMERGCYSIIIENYNAILFTLSIAILKFSVYNGN